MKYTFWMLLKHYWDLEITNEYIIILCPLFEFRAGMLRNIYFDLLEEKVSFFFWNTWPLYEDDLLFKKNFEKIYSSTPSFK